MGNLGRKKLPGNLYDKRLMYDYENREFGTMPPDNKRQPFRWTSEIAYKNIHRIVARGYDTTELVEAGYGLADVLFIDFQSRIPLIEEAQMLHYVMILALEDGLSSPASYSQDCCPVKDLSDPGLRSFDISLRPCFRRLQRFRPVAG